MRGGWFTRVTGVTRGDGTEGGEEGKGDERGEEGGEEILAHGRTGQSKVVQEVLADLKIHILLLPGAHLATPW